jgi:hypothetical protein
MKEQKKVSKKERRREMFFLGFVMVFTQNRGLK